MKGRGVLRPVPEIVAKPRFVRRRRPSAAIEAAHPFLVETIRVLSASGAVKEINPRTWPEYGLKGT